jgi:hypothetical protein
MLTRLGADGNLDATKEKHLQRNCYKCLTFRVEVAGFEPAAPCSQSRCANRTAPHLELIYGLAPEIGTLPLEKQTSQDLKPARFC